MRLRWLCLLTLIFFAAPLRADEEKTTEPAAAAAAPQTPAAANATAEVPASEEPAAQQPPVQQTAVQQAAEAPVTPKVLEQRVDDLLKDPGPMIDRTAVQNQLDDLTTNASQLAVMSADPKVRFEALTIQLQSIYTRLVEYPDAPDVDHQLGRLRAAARRIKTVNVKQSGAVGDFWLLTAELYDMNRTKLPLDARRKQAAMLMKDFLARHADWPPSMDVREALEKLEKKEPSKKESTDVSQQETDKKSDASPQPVSPANPSAPAPQSSPAE